MLYLQLMVGRLRDPGAARGADVSDKTRPDADQSHVCVSERVGYGVCVRQLTLVTQLRSSI
jgi:hypothetical protein